MSPLSLIPILPIILIALATLKLTSSILGIKPAEGHFASIDGLRGYMAFFVFLHHSSIWYLATHGYGWRSPPSNVYSQFGSTSVSVFFMITSFLFFSRLLRSRNGRMDWLRLYVSRGLRILPLYLFALFIVLITVGVLSHFSLHEPPGTILMEVLQWLAFIKANINGIRPTWPIIAGVIWSLPYEWLFYFGLPLLGVFLNVRVSFLVWVFAMAGFIFFLYVILQFYQSAGGLQRTTPFLSGIAAALLARIPWVRQLAGNPVASIFIILCLVIGVGWFNSASHPIAFLLVSLGFIGIACGNSIFGILTHPLSRTLGQISYSIYLLHGIVLYTILQQLLSAGWVGQLSPVLYWAVIATCCPIIIVTCSLTYYFIERPAMEAVQSSSEKIKKHLKIQKALVFK